MTGLPYSHKSLRNCTVVVDASVLNESVSWKENRRILCRIDIVLEYGRPNATSTVNVFVSSLFAKLLQGKTNAGTSIDIATVRAMAAIAVLFMVLVLS